MKRNQNVAAPEVLRASKRANQLIEAMLKEMQRAVRHPERLESAAWEQLFGKKQSMVVNLQKLVQALAALPQAHDGSGVAPVKEAPQQQALSPEEMRLLSEWLAEGQHQ